MIFDEIDNLQRYTLAYIEDVRKFLSRTDLSELAQSEIEIRGRDLFVRIMRYLPKPASENKFETHRCYADIQVVLEGRESMQVAPASELQPVTEYSVINDYQFYKVDHNISDIIVPKNTFTVFFPGEAHRPSCLVAPGDGEVFKLVFKVRMGNP